VIWFTWLFSSSHENHYSNDIHFTYQYRYRTKCNTLTPRKFALNETSAIRDWTLCFKTTKDNFKRVVPFRRWPQLSLFYFNSIFRRMKSEWIVKTIIFLLWNSNCSSCYYGKVATIVFLIACGYFDSKDSNIFYIFQKNI